MSGPQMCPRCQVKLPILSHIGLEILSPLECVRTLMPSGPGTQWAPCPPPSPWPSREFLCYGYSWAMVFPVRGWRGKWWSLAIRLLTGVDKSGKMKSKPIGLQSQWKGVKVQFWLEVGSIRTSGWFLSWTFLPNPWSLWCTTSLSIFSSHPPVAGTPQICTHRGVTDRARKGMPRVGGICLSTPVPSQLSHK